jgi:rod shape-determining protein MreD
VTPGARAPLRIAPLVLLFVIVQVSGLAAMRVLGGTPDVVPLLVAAVALYGGAVPATITGFFAGLLVDLAVGANLGAAALVLTAVGYGVGRSCEVRPPAHSLAPIPIAAAATAGYVVGFAAVAFMLQTGAEVSALVLREMALTVLLGALLALPSFAFVRRVLRPVLAVDPAELRRRRRAQPRETGPIGLRGLEV